MKKYNPEKHHRRSIRLKGYDYSQSGSYFITICTQNHRNLFGDIQNEKMILNDAGRMVDKQWCELPERFLNIRLRDYIVMPNHFHAILEIVGATLVVAPNNIAPNGVAPNGVAPNGVAPNGVAPNGVAPNGVAPNNIALNGVAPNGVAPNGVAPNGVAPNGVVQNNQGQPQGIAPTEPSMVTVGDMVGAFQSIVTVEYIRGVREYNWRYFNGKLWQRNYWEHIIRNEKEFMRISQYIINNPANWKADKLNNGHGNCVMESQSAYGNEIWMV